MQYAVQFVDPGSEDSSRFACDRAQSIHDSAKTGPLCFLVRYRELWYCHRESTFVTERRSWLRGAVAPMDRFDLSRAFNTRGFIGLLINLGLFAQQALEGTAIWNAQQSTPHRSAKIN